MTATMEAPTMSTPTSSFRNAPVGAKVMRITPALAAEWLRANTMNRNLRSAIVTRLARDMESGHWVMNGAAIRFDHTGRNVDGQHRLHAIVRSGVTIESLVVWGLPDEAHPTIDTGSSRSWADVLAMRGQSTVKALAATCRLWWWYYDERHAVNLQKSSPSHAELDDLLARHPALADRVREVNGGSGAKKIAPASVLGLVYATAHSYDAVLAHEWLTLFATGAGLPSDSPVYLFRERMIANRASKAKLPQIEVLALAIKSWNAFAAGQPMRNLRWRAEGPGKQAFPEMIDFADDDGDPRPRRGGLPAPRALNVGEMRLTAKLACPHCWKTLFDTEPRTGDLFVRCERRTCGCRWWAVVVEPRATGTAIRDLIGDEPLAAAFLRRLVPAFAELPAALLWRVTLTGDARSYIVAPVHASQIPTLSRAPAPTIIRELRLV
jgi:hypothetical protein